MAEQLRFNEFLRNGRTVHRDESPASTRERMDRLRHDFLPGAALSEEQYGHARGRHRARVANDIGERRRHRAPARWVRLEVARVDERRSADWHRRPKTEERMAELESITVLASHALAHVAVSPGPITTTA